MEIITAAVAATLALPAFGQAFYLTGAAPGTLSSRAYELSADGTRAAGWSFSISGSPGFVWSTTGSREDFGQAGGVPTTTAAAALSGDGLTVVGAGNNVGLNERAFRWSGPGTYQNLGTFSFYTKSFGQGVSGDGSIVVGRGELGTSGTVGQAFRWTSTTGMVGLGVTQPTHSFSEAAAISRDGTTIVGTSRDGDPWDGFIWTAQTGMLALPALPGTGERATHAVGVNSDGTIIVGTSGAVRSHVIWRNGLVESLGIPSGCNSSAVCNDRRGQGRG